MLYGIRLTFVMIWVSLASFLLTILFLFRPFHRNNALIWCRVVPPVARWLMNLKLEIRNHMLMKESHPCVYVANHQHALDLIVFAETLLTPTSAIGKKELKFVPFYGWVFWLSGQIMIDRKNHGRAVQTVSEAAKLATQKNFSLWFFPEGTRSKGKGLGAFKKGAFHMALQTQRPILPMVCNSFHTTLNLKKWNPGKVIIQVLEPIDSKNFSIETIDQFIATTRDRMVQQIQKLDEELSLQPTPAKA